MAEIPVGYFPDVKCEFSTIMSTEFDDPEIERALSGREQRREMGPALGQRMWRATTIPTEGTFLESLEMRRAISEFLRARKGKLQSFYFFAPDPVSVIDAAVGSVAAASRVILPYKGGSYSDIRVAGVTKAFTVLALAPRTRTYAALRFDGTDDRIDAGTSATLRTTGDMTLAAWVMPSVAIAGNAVMSNETLSASGASLAINIGGTILFATSQAGARVTVQSATGVVPVGAQTHIAVVRSGTNATFFANGVQLTTVGGVTSPVVATAQFVLGRFAGTAAAPFNGLISGARFYDVALSAGEIANIYNGIPSASASLRGHWRLTEGTGTSVADSSGYGNTGTLINGPVWVAGEDEITFTAGAQTGAVTVTGLVRPRVIVRSNRRSVQEQFLDRVATINALFPIEFLEMV